MCGIAGIASREQSARAVSLMCDTLAHRGPNAAGYASHQIGPWHVDLGHRRLSIIDLSDAANQPMASADGKHILVYNGEAYNYVEVRRELEAKGVRFRTQSDTEVLLEALRMWGCREALRRFNGMWAFAWLDLESGRLTLGRDRMGVKPLYFHATADRVVFGSEIKALLRGLARRLPLNHRLVCCYLKQSLLDIDDETFFEGILKLPAAHFATIDLRASRLDVRMERYWEIPLGERSPDIVTACIPERAHAATIEEFRETFFDSVRLRLRSDVPVGMLLSGGLDSSSIAAALKQLGCRIALISSVSTDPRFDESRFIDAMSRHLGVPVEKVVLDFTPQRAMELLEEVSWFNDEPVGSFSNVAHYLLMRRARELGVTVILSGQGGDELLAGYKKYVAFYAKWLARKGQLLTAAGVVWHSLRQGTVVRQFNLAEAKRYLPAYGPDIRGSALRDQPLVSVGLGDDTVNARQAADATRFSVPILLHYEDRMSMAWSREIRVPFLDYRLVEKLVPLDMRLKVRRGWTKWILRKAMEPYLPRQIAWRRDKQGFVNPQSEWLRNELRQEVLRRFQPDAMIFNKNLVDRAALLSLYDSYTAGSKSIWFREIFNPLALETWLRRFEEWL